MSTTLRLGESGITLGEIDSLGCRWGATGDEPWSPSPAPRANTGDLANDHGSWDATEFYGPRSYALDGYIIAPTHQALHQAKGRLFAACPIGAFELRVSEPGFERFGTFRRNGEAVWAELSPISPPTARFSVPLIAVDPRIYGTNSKTATTNYPSTSGGLEWSATWPVTWDATVTSGQMVLTNEGDSPAPVLWRIDGPVTDPMVVDLATGDRMRVNLDIPAGDWITIDTATHRVLYRGEQGATRRSKWSGRWLGVNPGSHQFGLSATTGDPAAELTATYRDTWI